ncbi:MAG: hypothetical protein II007_13550 [Gammaproteobacteria bacterium]|nr:hypothetical protein [Gammaproteobacteria bacterium]
MFWFRSRKRYNGAIDQKLNNEYQIATRGNTLFPGMLAYLSLVDDAWGARLNEDEGALFIATLFYCGIRKNGLHDMADDLGYRVAAVTAFGLKNGAISQQHADKCVRAMQDADINHGGLAPRG